MGAAYVKLPVGVDVAGQVVGTKDTLGGYNATMKDATLVMDVKEALILRDTMNKMFTADAYLEIRGGSRSLPFNYSNFPSFYKCYSGYMFGYPPGHQGKLEWGALFDKVQIVSSPSLGQTPDWENARL